MENFIYQALLVILTTLSSYIAWLLREQKKRHDADSHGIMLLLRDRLIEYHNKYVRKGQIPSYAYENFLEIYNAYHDLGGNGMATKMKKEIEELNLRTKEENSYEN